MEYDFSKVTIGAHKWSCVWAQCMANGITREIWVGDETNSFLVGHAKNRDEAMKAVTELFSMREAAQLLRGKK